MFRCRLIASAIHVLAHSHGYITFRREMCISERLLAADESAFWWSGCEAPRSISNATNCISLPRPFFSSTSWHLSTGPTLLIPAGGLPAGLLFSSTSLHPNIISSCPPCRTSHRPILHDCWASWEFHHAGPSIFSLSCSCTVFQAAYMFDFGPRCWINQSLLRAFRFESDGRFMLRFVHHVARLCASRYRAKEPFAPMRNHQMRLRVFSSPAATQFSYTQIFQLKCMIIIYPVDQLEAHSKLVCTSRSGNSEKPRI